MTDLVYIDYNCFQRGFDDPRQTRIRMEALACQDIFIKAKLEEITLIWSFMHDDETSLCPFVKRKLAISSLANLYFYILDQILEKRVKFILSC